MSPLACFGRACFPARDGTLPRHKSVHQIAHYDPEALFADIAAEKAHGSHAARPVSEVSDGSVQSLVRAESTASTTFESEIEVELSGDSELVPLTRQGSSSVVHVERPSTSGSAVAVKEIPCTTSEEEAAASRELELGRLLSSRPECRFPAVLDSDFSGRPGPDGHVTITYELLQGGTVEQLLRKRRLSEGEAKIIAHALFSALAAIHREEVVHSDIKPGNLMFAEAGSLASLRVVDLGLAALRSVYRSADVGALSAYSSPEQVRTKYTGVPGFGTASDVWSAGVVVFELLSGKAPFKSRNVEKMLQQILASQPSFAALSWELVSDEAKDFVERVMHKDPARRLTAKAALKHAWLAGIDSRGSKNGLLSKLMRRK
eukprot:jgi/Tetstr1/448477/TSEL_035745.t1